MADLEALGHFSLMGTLKKNERLAKMNLYKPWKTVKEQ